MIKLHFYIGKNLCDKHWIKLYQRYYAFVSDKRKLWLVLYFTQNNPRTRLVPILYFPRLRCILGLN